MTPLDFVFGLMVIIGICLLMVIFYERKQEKLNRAIAKLELEMARREFEDNRKRQVREDFEKECE
jgi:hypothetical protein